MGSNVAGIDVVAVPLDADRLEVYRVALEFDASPRAFCRAAGARRCGTSSQRAAPPPC